MAKQPPTQAESSTGLNPGAPSYQPVPTATTLCSDSYLQTARTVVHNPSDPRVSIKVHQRQRRVVHHRASQEPAGTYWRATTLDRYIWIQQGAYTKVRTIVNVPPLYVVPSICNPLVSNLYSEDHLIQEIRFYGLFRWEVQFAGGCTLQLGAVHRK